MKIIKSKKIFFKLIFCLVFLFSFIFFVSGINATGVTTIAPKTDAGDTAKWSWEKAKEALKKALTKVASQSLKTAVTNALNKMAYDAAGYVASGGRGQNPMVVSESMGEYFTNIADEAAGDFVSEFGKDLGNLNFCNPDFFVQVKIGLGLTKQERPEAPKCTFSQMKENWDQAIHDDNFLNDFQDMFEPTSSDLGLALTAQTKIMEDKALSTQEGLVERLISGRWMDPKGIDEKIESIPGVAKDLIHKVDLGWASSAFQFTGDALVDAAKVFVNQLAIETINNLLKSAVKNIPSSTSPFNWDAINFEADPGAEGITAAKEKLRKIIEPKFDTRGDYDILSQLSFCPSVDKSERVGPTDCVIDDKFRQAIQEKVTVGNALKLGYLNPGFVFGYKDNRGQEPYFKEGYPYRSMIILRNYRILPVGWELAAQYIKEHGDAENTLESMIACFDPDDKYEGYSAEWCEGMVDPNWVLKAPQNYCRREGPGSQIISYSISGKNDKSELSIKRNDEYCADNWACIQEEDDGSCRYYGYCTEEKRGWRFNADSCESKYNTCQTYRKRDGQTMSILENTLDYGNCSIDNVGCMAYSITYDGYNSEINDVSWNGEDNIYFDKDAKECNESNEGCHEFVRIKPGIGANLMVRNASFEDFIGQADDGVLDSYDWFNDYEPGPAPEEQKGRIGEASSDSYDGLASIMAPNYAGALIFIRGETFENLVGESATFSLYAKDCTENDLFFTGAQYAFDPDTSIMAFNPAIERAATGTLGSVESDGWVRYALTYKYTKDDYLNPQVPIYAGVRASGNCKVDATKIELGDEATVYSDYNEVGVVYQKILPSYLENTCYKPADGEGFIYAQDDAPAICENFTRYCTQGELGCQFYTSLTDGFTVPAKISVQDECPAECVGFDTYLQTETFFEDESEQYFIPKTAQKCTAQFVGCDEFTNLDEVEQGGEGKEYYSYVRTCRNPDDQCSSFYTWEGSSETGYQLKIYNLEREGTGPRLTNLGQYNGLECNSGTYDLEANPACREFYNTSGEVFYRFYPYTITCSEDCHPLRRTVDDDYTQASCTNHGGEWDLTEGACIYMAIPSQGITCRASQAGCREYSGNTGNNKRIISQSNFEGSSQGWEGVGATIASPSSESLMMGGNSLFVSSGSYTARMNIGILAEQGKSYVVQFIAKPEGTQNTSVSFEFNNGIDSISFGSVTLKEGIWFNFELNLASLDIEVNEGTNFVVVGDHNFYIDDIKLTEITDRYYLIKDSWTFPMRDSSTNWCEWDLVADEASALYSLGCDAYKDQDNKGHYLRQFSKLCPESSAGCEPVIDTHNYSPYFGKAKAWNDDDGDNICQVTDGDDCVEASLQDYKSIVYRKDKKCNAKDKGCQRFGQEIMYDGEALYQDKWLINNPDSYDQILCEEDDTFCEEWSSQSSLAYFKDPGDQLCEWRQSLNQTENSGWDWFRTKVKRCDNGSGLGSEVNDGIITASQEVDICFTSQDCGTGLSCERDDQCGNLKCIKGECTANCILDQNDYLCPTSNLKTIGYSGAGGRVEQPTNTGTYWIGLCPGDQAGCTEYIDPMSNFNTNLIFNPTFKDFEGDGITPRDGWISSGGGYAQRDISIKDNTLYRFGGIDGGSESITLTCTESFYNVASGNNLADMGTVYPLNFTSTDEKSVVLYFVNKAYCDIEISDVIGEAIFKEVIIDYRLKQEVDRKECNGIVDPGDGCVLFNERTINGGRLTGLRYDADLSPNVSGAAETCSGGSADCDSNVLLKVSPDRDCAAWIDCMTYELDDNNNPICYGLGECNSLDDSGECNSIVIEAVNSAVNQIYDPADFNQLGPADITNKTGYTKIGHVDIPEPEWPEFFWPSDLFPYTAMIQEGNIVKIHTFNGSFEDWTEDESQYDETNKVAAREPDMWSPYNGDPWTVSKFNVISDPVTSQNESIDFNRFIYAPDGKSYLAFSANETLDGPMTTSFIDIFPETDYIISAWINTQHLASLNPDLTVSVYLAITPYDTDGNVITELDEGIYNYELGEYELDGWVEHILYAPSGLDWALYTNKFRAGPQVQSIKIRFSGSTDGLGDCTSTEAPNCQGTVYVDDIKIMPALHIREDSSFPLRDEYSTQTCRLYPDDEALSCDYFEESGIRKKGWWGYCLEYDRYPGDENTCVQWWPVDRVEGDNVITEQNMGYDGRYPNYYCTAKEEEQIYEYRHVYVNGSRGGNEWCGTCYPGYLPFAAHHDDLSANECAYWNYNVPPQFSAPDCDDIGLNDDLEDPETICFCLPDGIDFVASDGSPGFISSLQAATSGDNDWCDNTVYITSEYDGWYRIDQTDTPYFGPWYIEDDDPYSGLAGGGDINSWNYCLNNPCGFTGSPYPWSHHCYSCSGQPCHYGAWISPTNPNVDMFCPDPSVGCHLGSEVLSTEFSQEYGTSYSDLATKLGTSDLPREYCSELVQTVRPTQENMYWNGRVNSSSNYYFPCEDDYSTLPNGEADGACYHDDDYFYFGSIVYPAEVADDPSRWDSKATLSGQQPIYFERKVGDTNPGQPRAGALHENQEYLMRIFAESYGKWEMSRNDIGPNSSDTYQIIGGNWHAPTTECPGGVRPVWEPTWDPTSPPPVTLGTCDSGSCTACPGPTCDFCGVYPRVYNIKVNDQDADAIVSGMRGVEVSFNAFVDIQQLPLATIEIEWGDATPNLNRPDLNIMAQTDADNPHSYTHEYSFLSSRLAVPASCPDDCSAHGYPGQPCCVLHPRIRITDNWEWSSGWNAFAGDLILIE